MLHRGGKLQIWEVRCAGDATWSADDWARAATLEARWRAAGVDAAQRARLLPCAITLRKWPGTKYAPEIMEPLAKLLDL